MQTDSVNAASKMRDVKLKTRVEEIYSLSCQVCGVTNQVCQASSKTKKVNVLEDVEQGDTDTDDMFLATDCISNVKSKGLKWFVHLRLNKKKQACQLDTGATCNMMSSKIKEKLSPGTPKHNQAETIFWGNYLMLSQGRFHTDCVIRGEKHGLFLEVHFHRHILSSEGLKIDPEKTLGCVGDADSYGCKSCAAHHWVRDISCKTPATALGPVS